MMPSAAGTVNEIYRYPVKGLSAEKMDRVTLTPGECLPHDRRFAIALGTTAFDGAPGMAVENTFRHADAGRKTGAVADAARS